MKSTTLIFILVLIINAAYSQDKISKKEARENKRAALFEEAKSLLDTAFYEFTGQAAFPQGGQRVDLTSNPNFLRIIDDSVSAYLPFFGRAYSVAYGAGGGIKFNGKPEKIIVEVNKNKQQITVSFKIKGEDDSYSCLLTLNSLDNASLNVTSNNRAGINYQGKIASYEIATR